MCRCNAFLRAGSDSGREVSVGGRKSQDHVWGEFNTDNAGGSNCELRVSASVLGYTTAVDRRKHGDNRKSVFTVQTPNQANEYCETRIHCGNDGENVFLENGVSVKTALKCVELIQRFKAGEFDHTDAGFFAKLELLLGGGIPAELAVA